MPPYLSELVDMRIDEALKMLLPEMGDDVLVLREMLIERLGGKVVLMDQEHFDGMCREVKRKYGHK